MQKYLVEAFPDGYREILASSGREISDILTQRRITLLESPTASQKRRLRMEDRYVKPCDAKMVDHAADLQFSLGHPTSA